MKKPIIKTKEEIELMVIGGKILGKILKELSEMVHPGLDAYTLEERFTELCNDNQIIPVCKGYDADGRMNPYPYGLCVSINEESVHCYPKKGKIMNEGDLVTIDSVISYKGMLVDSAVTVAVGKISDESQRILDTSMMALNAAINQVKPGNRVGDISNAIETITKMAGYSVLVGYTGHGVGKYMHEAPSIPCYGSKGTGTVLEPGMTLAIEPLVCQFSNEIAYYQKNGWETYMKDGGLFVQVEHTVLVTQKGCRVLTEG